MTIVSMSDSESCGDGKSAHHHDHQATVKPTKQWYCPMCPGAESDEPGACPKCGMALERNPAFANRTVALEPVQATLQDENGELRSMVLRFKVGLILGLPVLVLAMGGHFFGLDAIPPRVSAWIQFIVATPIVLWCGWPFFERGARSVIARNLNMFTLIALGTGTAYTFSVFALLFPGLLPHSFTHDGELPIYFEAASFIVVLVLLGQVLELRARAATGEAIR